MRLIPGGPAFDEARQYDAVAHRTHPIEALDVHREGFQSAAAKILSPPGLLPGDACAICADAGKQIGRDDLGARIVDGASLE